jgi:putative ABC transport system substrate-binding protein
VPEPRAAFLQGLRDLGYVEGHNLLVESRYAAGDLGRLDQLAVELARLKVDVIVAAPTQVTQAAQRATKTIPIVMPVSRDPVGAGLVASLARPGGNVTGLAALGPALDAKQVQLLRELLPGASRIALLWNGSSPAGARHVSQMNETARGLGVQLQPLEVRGPEDCERAFAAAAKQRAGAIVVTDDALLFAHRARIAQLALAARLPGMFLWKEYAEAGGLIACAPDMLDLYRRAATVVDKILKGAKPAGLPVEQPTKFVLVVNLKTAKALGLTIPRSVLVRADQVLQ